MPIGDPCGCNDHEYGGEGLPSAVSLAEIPVKDMDRAVRFYCNILKMEMISQNGRTAILRLDDGCRIALAVKDGAGADTGIYLKADDPFSFNRRMTDEGVIIKKHPAKGEYGITMSFADSEGNVLHII